MRAAAMVLAVAGAAFLAAPAGAQIGGLLGPVVGIVNAGQSALCSAGAGSVITQTVCAGVYSVFTVRRDASGALVSSSIPAVVGAPVAVDGDGDGDVDLLVTLEVTSLDLDRFRLRIARVPGAPADLPVSVEAVVRLPTTKTKSSDRDAVHLGYDALGTSAPADFDSDIRLLRSPDTVPEEVRQTTIELHYATAQATPRALTVIGGMFNGSPTSRAEPIGGRLAYAAMPAKAGVTLTVGPRMTATHTTSQTTRLDLTATYVEKVAKAGSLPGQSVVEKHGGATIIGVPKTLRLDLARGADGSRTITYEASAAVPDVDAFLRHDVDGIPQTHMVLDASGLPTGVTVEQTGPTQATISTAGGPIGRVQVGFANGSPRLLPDEPGAYVHTFSDAGKGYSSFAAQIRNLQRLTFTALTRETAAGQEVARIDTELRLAPEAASGARALRILVKNTDGEVDGQVSRIPDRVDLTLDLSGGRISYDGFGETVKRITVDGSSAVPFFGEARHLSALVEGLPPEVDVTFPPDADGDGPLAASFSTSAPVSKIEILAQNRPIGASRAQLLDDVLAQALSPQEIAAAKQQAKASGGSGLNLSGVLARNFPADTGSGKGTVYEVGARVFDLRSVRLFAAERFAVKSSVGGAPRPFTAVFENQKERFEAHVRRLPRRVNVSVDPGATPAAKVRLAYRGSSSVREIRFAAARKFRSTKLPVPARPFFDDATHLAGTVKGIPRKVTVTVGPERRPASSPVGVPVPVSGVSFTTTRTLRSMEFLASDRKLGPSPLAGVLRAGQAGVVYRNRPGAYALGGRVFRLTTARFALVEKPRRLSPLSSVQGAPVLGYRLSAQLRRRGPFTAIYEDADRSLRAQIQDLPRSITVNVTPSTGTVDYNGSAKIGRLILAAHSRPALVDGTQAHWAAVVVTGFPRNATLTVKPDGTSVAFSATKPIARVEALITDAPLAKPGRPLRAALSARLDKLLAKNEAGAVYRNTAKAFAAGGRVFGLRSVTFTTRADAYLLDAQFGQPTGASSREPRTGRRRSFPMIARPFNVLYHSGDERVVGRARNLPREVSLSVDTGSEEKSRAGRITYTGSSPIKEISFEALRLKAPDGSAVEPFFGRATRIRGRIDDFPRGADFTFQPGGGTVALRSTQPIGFAEIAFDDRTANPPPTVHPGGPAGVSLVDVASEPFRGFARIRGLLALEYNPTPLKLAVRTVAPQSFDARARLGPEVKAPTEGRPADPLSDELTLDVQISKLQTAIDINETAPRRFDYRASAAGGSLLFKIRGLPGEKERGEPRNAEGLLTPVPKSLTLDLGSNASTGEVLLDSSDAQASMTLALRLWDRGPMPSFAPSGGVPADSVRYDSGPRANKHGLPTQGDLGLAVRFDFVRRLRLRPKGPKTAIEANFAPDRPKRSLSVALRVREDSPNAPLLEFDSRVSKMPQKFLLEFATDPFFDASLDMSEPIPQLDLELRAYPELHVETRIEDIPRQLKLCLDERAGACGRKGFLGNTDDHNIPANQIFIKPLGALALNINTVFSAQDYLTIEKALICVGDGVKAMDIGGLEQPSGCSFTGEKRTRVSIDTLQLRDAYLAVGGGDLCDGSKEIEEAYVGLALDTGPSGIKALGGVRVISTARKIADCDPDDSEVDTTKLFIASGGALRADNYATVLDATNLPDDVYNAGSIQCPPGLLIEVGTPVGKVNAAGFLNGC